LGIDLFRETICAQGLRPPSNPQKSEARLLLIFFFYCKRCSITALNGIFEMFRIDVHFTDIFVGKIIKILHTLAFDEHEAARGCTLMFLGWQKVLFDTSALQMQNWYLGTSKSVVQLKSVPNTGENPIQNYP
jgi:hypothetical protein